jgi:hypothetical protein
MTEAVDSTTATPARPTLSNDGLSRSLVLLLKGVLYRDIDAKAWSSLIALQARAREHLGVLGLELVTDEAEGWAFVKSRDAEPDDADDSETAIPRLVARRPLSFPVSVLLALLRRKLAEFDARGGDTRLVMSRAEIVEMLRVFLPDNSDESRLFSQIDAHVNKVVDLGFLKRLGGPNTSGASSYEVRRIIKAFIDAHWLAQLDEHLSDYREALSRDLATAGGSDAD